MAAHKTIAIGIIALAVVAALTPASAYDSINCARDNGVAERTICADQRLQVLDAKVTEVYTDIMLDSHIKGHIKQAVHESQINFLKRRDQCGRDVACLAEVMSLRASRIRNYY